MTLVRQHVDLQKAVADGSISLASLLELLALEQIEGAPEPTVGPKNKKATGKGLALSEENRVVLRTIPTALASVKLPAEPRKLSQDEGRELIPLYVDLKKATKALESAENAIKEAFHGHFDADSSEDAEIDKNGHYLTEGELEIEGLDKKIVRGTVGGKAAGLTEADLLDLETKRLIDHATYLSLTVNVPATRTLAPEEKVMAVLKKNPELVKVLATKARLTAKSTAIRISDNA